MIITVALFVQGAGNQLFAGAGFAVNQYGGVSRGDLVDAVIEILHHIAGAYHPGDGGAGGDRTAAGLIGCFGFADHTLDGIDHLVVVEGLGDIVHGAHAHGVYCGAQAGVAGHDEYRRITRQFNQVSTGCAWQTQVADDQIKLFKLKFGRCLFYRRGFTDLVLVALKQFAQGVTDDGFVFNNQNLTHSDPGLALSVTGQ